MTLSDVSILGKKILVGIIITIIPFVIIAGGLMAHPKGLGRQSARAATKFKNNKAYTP